MTSGAPVADQVSNAARIASGEQMSPKAGATRRKHVLVSLKRRPTKSSASMSSRVSSTPSAIEVGSRPFHVSGRRLSRSMSR
jgi:hypothetical protein